MFCRRRLAILQIFRPGALRFAPGPTNDVAGPARWLKSWGEASVNDDSKTNPVLWPS